MLSITGPFSKSNSQRPSGKIALGLSLATYDEFHDAFLFRVNEAIAERVTRDFFQTLSRLCEVFAGLYPQGTTIRQSGKNVESWLHLLRSLRLSSGFRLLSRYGSQTSPRTVTGAYAAWREWESPESARANPLARLA